MNTTFTIITVLTGVAIAVIVHRTGFCVYGAVAEWFGVRSALRLISVATAILVFGLVHFWGFRGNIPCGGIWKGYAGIHSFLGGFIQGVGYVLVAGCPLTLLVRASQGSKSYIIAAVFFALGVSLFGHFKAPIVNLLSPLTLEAVTIKREQVEGKLTNTQKPLSFTLRTIDAGKITYEQKDGVSLLRYLPQSGKEQVYKNFLLLVYVAPSCCPFCHPEAISILKDIESKFSKKGLITVGIFRGHFIKEIIEPFKKKYKITWILGCDPEYAVLQKFGVTPETFFTVLLVDKEGKIRLKQEGFGKTDRDRFQQEIESIIGK